MQGFQTSAAASHSSQECKQCPELVPWLLIAVGDSVPFVAFGRKLDIVLVHWQFSAHPLGELCGLGWPLKENRDRALVGSAPRPAPLATRYQPLD